MTMRFWSVPMAAGTLFLAAAAAQADLTVQQQTTINIPAMKQMVQSHPGAQAGMTQRSTFYFSGKRSRVDSAMISIITDGGSGKMYMLSPAMHTYQERPFNAAQLAQQARAVGPKLHVTDTGHNATILGHPCHEYHATIEVNSPQGGAMTVQVDLWAASDIALNPATAQILGASGGLGALAAAGKVKGFPLRSAISVVGGPPFLKGMTTKTEVTAISTGPVSSSRFSVPAGYTQSAPMGMPGGGMGMPGAPH
jgi:hypothetical protein